MQVHVEESNDVINGIYFFFRVRSVDDMVCFFGCLLYTMNRNNSQNTRWRNEASGVHCILRKRMNMNNQINVERRENNIGEAGRVETGLIKGGLNEI